MEIVMLAMDVHVRSCHDCHACHGCFCPVMYVQSCHVFVQLWKALK